MTAHDEARAVADKLKAEKEAKESEKEQALIDTKSQLEAIKNNPNLEKMYRDNASLGSENLAGSLPLLKVHATGRSNSELADGSEPVDGNFFYTPTQEQFEEIDVHVLTISRGFRAKGINENEDKEVFNQILGGVIVQDGDYKPFLMYFTGLKLQPLWDFGKEANKYTHAKPIPVPLFALSVKLTTEKVTNTYGKSWIVKFEILHETDQDGNRYPKLVTDEGEFKYLKDNVETVQATIESVIARKEGAETVENTVVEKVEEAEDTPF